MLQTPSRRGILRDRREAGERLAERLVRFQGLDPVVLALPRGGVPVGAEIARRLNVPLEVLIVRKVGAPGNPEYGLGALVEDGTCLLDEPRIREAGYTLDDLEGTIDEELQEVRRRASVYRHGRSLPDLQDRVVILVDDGVATGGTVRAAVQSVRSRRPHRVVVALGVAPRDTFHQLGRVADEVIALHIPEVFFAVGEWYARFEQVTDEEVQSLLDRTHPTPIRPL